MKHCITQTLNCNISPPTSKHTHQRCSHLSSSRNLFYTLTIVVLIMRVSFLEAWTMASSFHRCRFATKSTINMMSKRPYHKKAVPNFTSPSQRATSYSTLPSNDQSSNTVKAPVRDMISADAEIVMAKLNNRKSMKKDDMKRMTLPPMASIAARHYVAEPMQKTAVSNSANAVNGAITPQSGSREMSTSVEKKDVLQKVIEKRQSQIPKPSSNKTHSFESIDKTGTYIRQWPDIFRAPTHYKRALRNLKTVSTDNSIKNARNQQRKFAAQSLDALMKGLTVPITQLITLYQFGFRTLHPFEQTVANLTLTARTKQGHPPLSDILQKLQRLRAQTSRIAKDYAKRANTAETATEARELLTEGTKALQLLYTDDELLAKEVSMADGGEEQTNAFLEEAKAFTELLVIHQDLKRIPVLELKRPTIVLVGAPNVGKSSLVRAISSGTPEVNDYPFTTRGVTIGHIYASDSDVTVTDTHSTTATTVSFPLTKETNSIPHDPSTDHTDMDAEKTEKAMSYIPAGKKATYQHATLAGTSSTDTSNYSRTSATGSALPPKPSPSSSSSTSSSSLDNSVSVRYQVMDTPGLLHRPDEERNEMERLTFASLAQLPTAVLFVIDPTELSGQQLSSLADQLQIRSYLKTRFPKRPWMDILSKSDLPLTPEQTEMLREAGIVMPVADDNTDNSSNASNGYTPCLRVSVRTGENLPVLRNEVRVMLHRLEEILSQRTFHTSNTENNADNANSNNSREM